MSVTTTKLGPNFRRALNEVSEQLVLKPLVELYLAEARFPDKFTVTFHKAGKARKPDGFFHSSTHPLWPARMLYYYLTAPDDMEVEMLSYESRMAVTMGTAVHGFVQMCIRDAGYMMPLPEGNCVACRKPHGFKENECDEFGVFDKSVGTKGHMDGIVRVPLVGARWSPTQPGLFEFKTMNPNKARGLTDNDLAWFIEKCPDYYAQVQEYMEASGLRQCLVLIAILGFPWKLVEIQVPYDPGFSLTTRNKYKLVREHQRLLVPPDPCCSITSKEAKTCPARRACPVGRMAAGL